jgi:cell division septation protein DedD
MVAIAFAAPALADVKAGVDAWARGDYKKAVEEWRGPAVAGDSDAQFNLGQAYKLGRGVPADVAMAEEWYRKAAVQGHPQAEDNYGLALFQTGKREQALPWLQKSVARGEPRAQYVLGTMYFNADSVTRDWVKAYALMVRANAAGLPQAAKTLAQMDRYISLTDRQQGTQLARQYETQAQRAALAPSVASAPPARQPDPRPQPAPPRPAPTPVATAPRPAPPPAIAPTRVDGGWRAQLGTFRDAANAHNLVATLQRKGAMTGLTPYVTKVGALTRLQVGPFASSAQAAQACAAIKRAGSECLPVKG